MSWQQNMRLLAAGASALDRQKAGLAPASTSKAHAASVKKALSSLEDLADAEDGMRAKFEHDMALSLQLTQSVAEEAGKLQHVKIVRAKLSQADLPSEAAELNSSNAQVADALHQDNPVSAAGHASSLQRKRSVTSPNQTHASPHSGLLQSSSRLTRSMLSETTDAGTDRAAVHSLPSSPDKPSESSPPVSPRLTRSSQAQQADSAQQGAANQGMGHHPAAARSPATAARSPAAAARCPATAARSPAVAARSPVAALSGSTQRSPGSQLQLTSPRLTRSMHAQLASSIKTHTAPRSAAGNEQNAAYCSSAWVS